MSEENVELVRGWMEAWQRGDRVQVEKSIDSFDPEIEWDASRFAERVPDLARVYHGAEGVRDFWRLWLSSWRDLQFEIKAVRDAGEEVVLLIENQRQWGRHSGIETQVAPYGFVFTFRDGRITRVALYPTPEGALEAAGLSE
jgi:ketosteroid isomerase-like protein